MSFSKHVKHVLAVLAVVLFAAGCRVSVDEALEKVAFKKNGTEAFPAVKLRGYGEISGEFISYQRGDDRASSCLKIQCENAERAELLQAKFISDMQSVGKCSFVAPSTELAFPHLSVAGQGAIVAARKDDQVFVFSAAIPEDIRLLLDAHGMAKDKQVQFMSAATVPMFLDSWDKYGWRYYYRPWETPQDVKWKDYNVLDEFNFAKKNGDGGFVFWANLSDCDTAQGMLNNIWWDWAARACESRKLPMVINTSAGAPSWLANRYREQTQQKMPQFCGNFYTVADGYHGGMGQISWCAKEAKDMELGLLQEIVKEYRARDNTIEFLEPHGELRHGSHDVFLEYGPVADRSFVEFLKGKYSSLGAVSTRWTGKENSITSWNDVKVPEVASFLGWNEKALDLTGTWRVQYFEGDPAEEFFQRKFDDSACPNVTAPGTDRTIFLPKKPAIYRRTFTVDPAWVSSGARTWLYVWDLNLGEHMKDKVSVYLNDRKAGEDFTLHASPHWAPFEVTDQLKAGENFLSVRLPKGYLAYRIYLSHEPPLQYPGLGENKNALWVDFIEWMGWTRLETCRRGMEMIRQADPDRSIVCMAPDSYSAGIKDLAEKYGAHFHNTGYMGAWWAEVLPMLMRGSDMPFSLEPGGPAANLADFKNMMGLYLTEGVNAVHYFIHIGNILWQPEIRDHFEKNLPALSLIGKVHVPKNEIAMLFSDNVDKLTGYPWGKDNNVNLPSGYFNWKFNESMLFDYRFDGLTQYDLKNGNADAYKVIVDTNNSVMDDAFVGNLEEWVKRGGTFVTFIQTGRHAPEQKDSWPISRITGYAVTGIDQHNEKGECTNWRRFALAKGQDVLDPEDWKEWGFDPEGFGAQPPADWRLAGNGLSLKKVAPECRDVLVWEDGSVAAGVRPLGKGFVVNLGVKFCHDRMWWGNPDNMRKIISAMLKWRKIKRVPFTIQNREAAKGLWPSYSVSNNGLFDVWTFFNSNRDKELSLDIAFETSSKRLYDPVANRDYELSGVGSSVSLKGMKLAALETKVLLSPRDRIADAPKEWLRLQRGWWKGRDAVPGAKLPEFKADNTLDISTDWAFLPLDEKAPPDDAAKFAAPGLDDKAWARMRLGVWTIPDELKTRNVMFRRTFTVPATWTNGEVNLWIRSFFAQTSLGTFRVWLDGTEIKPWSNELIGMKLADKVKAGESHLLAVQVQGEGFATGIRGNSWLSYIPAPAERIDLAGDWRPSKDALFYGDPVKLPGEWDSFMAKRAIKLDKSLAGKAVYLRVDSENCALIGALINGRWLRRHHHVFGQTTLLNIGYLLDLGADNEIEIVNWNGPCKGKVLNVSLDVYDQEL